MKYAIPKPNSPVLDRYGNLERQWYDYLRTLASEESADTFTTELAELSAKVAALESPQAMAQVTGLASIRTSGSLASGKVTVQLVGDEQDPLPRTYYSTDADGTKGYHPLQPNVVALADTATTGLYAITGPGTSATRAITGTPGQIEVADGDGLAGYPTLTLAELPDSGAGAALRKITRDAYGRLAGTQDATTTDLPEGDNLYFTDTRARDAVGAALDGGGDVPLSYDGTFHAALSPAVQASLDAADSAVQSIQPGANVTIDATDPSNPVISATGGGTSAVESVFGRVGAVTSVAGDYTFAQLASTPTTLAGYGITDAAPIAHIGSGGAAHANASTSTAGFMAAADKSKLDGIASGATANTGTVTSVAVADATGITWSGSPITSSGTLTPTLSANLQAWSGIATSTKEPAIAAGTTAQYWRGNKTWQDFATSVRAAVLTGLSTATNAAIVATDTVLVALGKLQAQVSGKEPSIAAGTTTQFFRGDKTWQMLDKTAVGLSNADNTSDANKPVSTATQTALDTKVAKAGGYIAGDNANSGVVSGAWGLIDGATNTPGVSWGTLQVITGITGRTTQLFNQWNGVDDLYHRRNDGGTAWTSWAKLWDSGNFDPATKASLTGATFTGAVGVGGYLRLNGFGGTTTDGITYYGVGDSYIYKTGTSFQIKNAEGGWTATLNNSGTIWTSGNFTPANKADIGGDPRFNSIYVGSTTEHFIYRSGDNLNFRYGTSSGYMYVSFTSTGILVNGTQVHSDSNSKRVYTQSADPGAVPDGSLWVW